MPFSGRVLQVIDYHDLTAILVTLTMAATHRWSVHQIDVKTAYLNAPLHHDIYMRLPKDTPVEDLRGRVVKLDKALYGLKQAGFGKTLQSLGWKSDELFPCHFHRDRNGHRVWLDV